MEVSKMCQDGRLPTSPADTFQIKSSLLGCLEEVFGILIKILNLSSRGMEDALELPSQCASSP